MVSIIWRRFAKISRSLSSICMSAWEGAELVSEESSVRAFSVLLSSWRRPLRLGMLWGLSSLWLLVLLSGLSLLSLVCLGVQWGSPSIF